ncbi:HAMP domain-containing histidine kinase [Rossellomorea aquimaris]|uniref:sensor histidine kinase n=1 Tax=Rossellomorea aquimaris TaxID=189382 RepID=UPI001CD77350|nr:HAMP domain-containing sensor histidine kinase [Rossellomorea aquimaris]MCA1060377.1 HAMP domain-containing histidine kinase [Rossellomorea aquimaris]
MGIRRRLLIQNLTLITMTILLFLGIVASGIYHYYYNGTAEILQNHAENSATFAKRYGHLSPYNLRENLQDLQSNFSIDQAETQILSGTGIVLSSSSGFIPDEKQDYPDVKDAFSKGKGTWFGTNPATGERILAVSVPLESSDKTIGILRFITSVEGLDENFQRILITLSAIGIGILGIVFIVSTFFSRIITEPVIELTNVSNRMAEGDLEARVNGQYKDEFHTLSQTFNNMGKELLRTEKMKNEFISSVSHELRTPLTSIKGWSETLQTGDPENVEETKTGLSIITKETDRLIDMVEELLDFSRYQNGTFEINPSPFYFDQLVKEVILQLDKKRQQKEQEIILIEDGPLKLMADQNRIRQVLLNLIENAIKYSGKNSTITVRYSKGEHDLKFEVEDQGEGIEEEHLRHVSTLFYKANENTDGVGLGLAICKQIIEHHDGELFIRSKKHAGTTVGFSLPLLNSGRG